MFHIKLLRKLKKSVSVDKWERALAKFAHTYNTEDGWEIERFGYKRCKLNLKLRLLKNLLEAQFDGNVKFKTEINNKPADELRSEPLGRDKLGNLYWYQVDNEATLRVYKACITYFDIQRSEIDPDRLSNYLSKIAIFKDTMHMI